MPRAGQGEGRLSMIAADYRLGFTEADVLVVTGAGSGIGAATAICGAQQGLTVLAWDRDARSVASTVERVAAAGGRAEAVVVDVADRHAVQAAWELSRSFGEVRHLANIAGPPSSEDLDFNAALTACVGSMHDMIESWLAAGVPPGATAVNMSSVAGTRFGTASDWYTAAKAAIAGYTRHLAAYRSSELRVNAIAPGMIQTPRLEGFASSPVGQRVLARIPMGRTGEPHEVAWTILYLLSPLSGYVNGAVLEVDGGWTVAQ